MERESKISHLLDGCNGQDWATLKPRTRSLIQVSHVGGRCPNSWVLFGCFPQFIVKELQ